MFKKSRVTDLKHRNARKKQRTRRVLARQLIKGDLTVDQLGRLAGEASNGVLRAVNYLSETEGITLTNTLADAVAQAVTPSSSSSSAILARRAAAVAAESKPTPVTKEPAVEIEEQVVNEAVVEITTPEELIADSLPAAEKTEIEITPTEAVEPPPPKKRTRASAKSVEKPETESAPKPRARASKTVATATKEEEVTVAPKKRARVSSKAAEPTNDDDKPTPKKRTRAPAKPKE